MLALHHVVQVIEYKISCNRYHASFSVEICHLLSFYLDLTFDLDHRRSKEEFVLGAWQPRRGGAEIETPKASRGERYGEGVFPSPAN